MDFKIYQEKLKIYSGEKDEHTNSLKINMMLIWEKRHGDLDKHGKFDNLWTKPFMIK